MAELVLPDFKFKQSYLAAVEEYQAERLKNYVNLDISSLGRDFDAYIQQLHDESQGKNLPESFIPHTVFWLVEGNEYIGRVDIRHELTSGLKKAGGHIGYDVRPSRRGHGFGKLILQLGLQKAREMGIDNILITCDVNNIPSRKVIEANGGELFDTRSMGKGRPKKNFFWIKSKNN